MEKLTLPTMEFSMKEIQTTNIFKDEALMSELNAKSSPNAYLPKVEEAFYKLQFPTGTRYPYVFSSIAFSADGKFAYPDNTDGDMLVHSHSLNKEGATSDYFVLNLLRAYSDAVMIGTKTMEAEANAFPTILDEELVEQRKEHMPDKKEQPFPIVVSKDGTDIPFHHVLFHQDLVPVVIFTSEEGLENLREHMGNGFYHMETFSVKTLYENMGKTAVFSIGSGGTPDLDGFLQAAKEGGLDHILNESPTLMWLLMKQNLLHEFFITYATVFIGGPFTLGLNMPAEFEKHPESRLAAINLHENTFIFTRQILASCQ